MHHPPKKKQFIIHCCSQKYPRPPYTQNKRSVVANHFPPTHTSFFHRIILCQWRSRPQDTIIEPIFIPKLHSDDGPSSTPRPIPSRARYSGELRRGRQPSFDLVRCMAIMHSQEEAMAQVFISLKDPQAKPRIALTSGIELSGIVQL